MLTKEQWDLKVALINTKIFSLYQVGEINLSNLYELRGLIGDMDKMMQILFSHLRFSLLKQKIRRDIQNLNNEYKIFEYNISLVSSAIR